jgi:hypothetical protein
LLESILGSVKVERWRSALSTSPPKTFPDGRRCRAGEKKNTFETGDDETLGSEDGGGKQAFVCIG